MMRILIGYICKGNINISPNKITGSQNKDQILLDHNISSVMLHFEYTMLHFRSPSPCRRVCHIASFPAPVDSVALAMDIEERFEYEAIFGDISEGTFAPK